MGYSSGKITAPVNTDDVSAVLVVSSHDIGTLCLSTRVNKWSKNKPYRGTSPDSVSRTVNDAKGGDNGTGVYCGNRGTATGFPVYWGLKYPMNNVTQLGNGAGTSHLLNLCYNVTVRQGSTTSGNGHPNYDYQKPVAGTDFFRETDFDGYDQDTDCFLEAGVVGATPGNAQPATIRLNKFDSVTIGAYAKCPPGATLWSLADIIPDSDKYYLVAEFYKTANWTYQNTADPFKVVKSSDPLSGGGRGMSVSVALADVISAGGFGSTTGSFSFYVCVGFVKYNGTAQVAAQSFVAPWVANAHRCATLVTIDQASPYVVAFSQYALVAETYNTYYSFGTTEKSFKGGSAMRFKGKITNNSNNAITLYSNSSGSGSNRLMFRVRAIGNYGKYQADNNWSIAEGGNDFSGPPRVLSLSTASNMSGTGQVTLAAKASVDLYFATGDSNYVLPYGETTSIAVEVSNDGGATWQTTGFEICNIVRTP